MDITISVQELHERVLELMEDNMDYVTVWISEAEGDDPAALYFEGSTKEEPFAGIEFGSIDAAELSD